LGALENLIGRKEKKGAKGGNGKRTHLMLSIFVAMSVT